MPLSQNPELVRSALAALIDALAPTPDGARICAELLRSAIGMLADGRPGAASAATQTALREIAESLGLAADHAAFLASRAAFTAAAPA